MRNSRKKNLCHPVYSPILPVKTNVEQIDKHKVLKRRLNVMDMTNRLVTAVTLIAFSVIAAAIIGVF